MSSSNNNKKNYDDEVKKKEPTDTLDVRRPLALLTHCDEEVSSFSVEKRLNAGKSRAPMQMEKKLAPTSSEKNDQGSSRYPISANTFQDKNKSMDKSSYALAAAPATAGQYHAHPFAEEAKEEELEDASTLLEDLAAVPKVSKKSVDNSNETLFAKTAKVEKQDQKAKTSQKIPDVPQDDNHSSGIFVTVLSATLPIQEVVAPPPHQTLPGAFPVQGIRTSRQNYSFVNGNVDLDSNEIRNEHGQLKHATLFNAELVIDPEIASATIFDQKAIGKAYCRHQLLRALGTFVVIGVIVCIIAIIGAVIGSQFKKPEPLLTTMAPSESPSASPSQSLFGFLAGHSWDEGAALSTSGSSQQKAMTWLNDSPLYNSVRDNTLLQFYALAVFNYATGDHFLNQSWLPKNGTVSEYDFCKWGYIRCNDVNETSFFYPDPPITGSLPPDIGLLTSLSYLDLSFKTFNGTLPTEIGLLSSLIYLDFSYNSFNGTLPAEFGHWTNLFYLLLSENTFTGTLPTEIGLLTSLFDLELFGNSVNGTIPTEIGLLTSLKYLDLSHNMFTGTLPTEIGLLTSLKYLYLSHNMFTGTLPTEIRFLTSLTYLDLSFNTFNTLPTEIGSLTNYYDVYD